MIWWPVWADAAGGTSAASTSRPPTHPLPQRVVVNVDDESVWFPLASMAKISHSYHAQGLGQIKESVTKGPPETLRLVSVKHRH